MQIARNQDELRAAYRTLGASRPVVVPTMGGLHAGHAALVRRGVREAEGRRTMCVVTVFVNPTQFDVAADFARYPRDLEADGAVVAGASGVSWVSGVSGGAGAIVYAPEVAEVYPEGVEAARAGVREEDLPAQAVGRGLEDAFRPGHFAGVALVLSRLYRLTDPGAAIYGEKDWQQLQVARAMAERLARSGGPAIEILGAPTVRDPDGLAMSSRNRFLTAEGRCQALAIPEALQLAQETPTPAAAERVMAERLGAAGLVPDYATVRQAETLLPLAEGEGPGRALIACPVGEGQRVVRLLDNVAWPGAGTEAGRPA